MNKAFFILKSELRLQLLSGPGEVFALTSSFRVWNEFIPNDHDVIVVSVELLRNVKHI